MIVDTHLHVWSPNQNRWPFASERAPSSEATVEVLNETMDNAGVDKAVIVQPIHYLYDNRYVADCLRRFAGKYAAIGLVDRHAPDAPDQLERLVKEHGFSGLRIHLGKPDDPSEWAATDQDPIWDRAEELGASFVVYGPAALLPAVEPIIARHQNVVVALDHIGGAPTDEEPPYPLLTNVTKMAQYPNVYMKLTPQPHKSNEPFPHKDTFPTFRRLYDAFGPDRLMWGTNFPGVVAQTGYKPALEIFSDHIAFLTSQEKKLLLGETALKLYNFEGPPV